MTRKLKIARDLSLPLDVSTEKIGWLGRTGSGKTYGAMKLAELLYEIDVQFVAIDYVGVWWGLRLAADGKAPGIPIPVLGGMKGDVPLEAGAGKIVADLIVDRGISAVIDVSQFESDTDKARFASDFASRFFFRKKSLPSPVHLFVEEAQEFVPQNPMRDEARMLHSFHRLIKLGRNFGIGVSLISQRPQEVNKKALNQTEVLFAFQMTGPQERKAVQTWIAEKGIDEDIEGALPKLRQGAPHVWSPALLEISRVVSIAKRVTFDASSTPKVGVGRKVRELAPIDIETLTAEIKATVERAKADDPKELRRKIAELERLMKQRGHGKPIKYVPEKPLIDPKAIERAARASTKSLRSALERAMKFIINISAQNFDVAGVDKAELERAIGTAVTRATEVIEQRAGARAKQIESMRKNAQQIAAMLKHALGDDEVQIDLTVARSEPFVVSPTPRARERTEAEGNGDLPKGEKIVLTALAQYDDGVTTDELAVLTGYKSTSRRDYLQRLTQKGFVVRATGQKFRATPEGIAALGADYERLPERGEELFSHWMGRLPAGEAKVLSAVAARYPGALSKGQVETVTGYKSTSARDYLQRLRSRRLVDRTPGGEWMASENLFS